MYRLERVSYALSSTNLHRYTCGAELIVGHFVYESAAFVDIQEQLILV